MRQWLFDFEFFINFQSFHRPYWANLNVNACYEGKADEGEKLHHKPKIEYVGSFLAKESVKIAEEYNREDNYFAHPPEVSIFSLRNSVD